MRITLLLAFCIGLTQCVLSQNNDIEKNVVSEKYAVTLTPAFFPYVTMGIQPGFQFKIGNRFALMNEIAIPVVISDNNLRGNYDKTQFFRVASELKLFRAKSPEGRFSSIQFGFIKRRFEDIDSGWYHKGIDTVLTGYSNLVIKSPVFFCNLKIGGEVVEWKKVFMDFFIGVGIRITSTKYDADGAYIFGRWFPPTESFAWLVPGSSWQYNGTVIRPHLSLGFRIGGKF